MATMTFNSWLKTVRDSDGDLKTLQDLDPNSSKIDDYLAAIQTKAPAADRDRLLSKLTKYIDRWLVENGAPPSDTFGEKYGTPLLILFGFLIAAVLVYGLFNQSFFNSIASVDQARGLITFLFAFATISIIILTTIATFWMEKDEVEARFSKAKDLVAILIGVLGTIIGFYFGSGSTAANPGRPLEVANIALSSYTAMAGDKVTLSATLQNGSAPYRYQIAVDDSIGVIKVDPKERKSEKGAISEEIQIPEAAKATSATFTVSAKDAKGNEAHGSSKPLSIQPKQ